MAGPASPLQLEDLLARSSWIRPLARRLLSDDAEAEDIVQESCLAFLCRSPRSVEAAGPWLGRVVRNLVLRSRQARKRRERRERRAARPERISVTADQMLEQAEIHRLLVEEVLRMDEPYRSTVLLRFFGELTPAQIARRQEVPLDTVKTRLRRAIGRLRSRLDLKYGDREAWTLSILPLAGGMAALSSAPAGASTASICSGLGLTGGMSSAAAVTGISLGGLIVAQKTALFTGLIGILTLAGFGLGRFTSKPDAEEVKARLDLQMAREAKAALEEDTSENDRLTAANASLEEENSRLEKTAAQLREKVSELEAKASRVEDLEKSSARRGPRLTFRDMGELEEALLGANWREMAEAAAEMTSKLEKANQSDTEPTQDQMIEFRLQEQKLISIGLKMMNKLPSHISDGNGGFTHPIIHWNLLAERLDLAGLPLSEAQVDRMSRLGLEYDAAWERQEAGHGTDTLLLEKVMNEFELKRAYNERLMGLLTRKQREVMVDPALHDTYPYDLYSPLLLLAGKIEPVARSTRDKVRSSMEKVFAERYGLSQEQIQAASAAFVAWLGQVEPLLATPLASSGIHRLYFLSGAEALAAGRAQTTLMREVLALLPSDAAARGKMASTPTLYVPRLLEEK